MKQILFIAVACLLLLNFACNKPDGEGVSGNLWQKLNTPYFGRPLAIQFTSSDTGYILGQDTALPLGTTLIKTFDGGQTWEKIYFPYVVAHGDDLQPVGASLQVSPFNSNILFSMAGGINIVYIIRSDDGGDHWKIVDSTQGGGAWGNYHFLSPAHIIRSGAFIYKSIDSGFTWSKVFDPQSGFAHFDMLQFTSDKVGYTAGGITYDATNYGIMAKTADGGNTWQNVGFPFFNIVGMSFINDNVGYISMRGDPSDFSNNNFVLYKTMDGGNSWDVVNKEMGLGGYFLYFFDEKNGFCLGNILGSNRSGILHTSNGGLSWKMEFEWNNSFPILLLSFPNSSCGFAIDTKGNVYKRTI